MQLTITLNPRDAIEVRAAIDTLNGLLCRDEPIGKGATVDQQETAADPKPTRSRAAKTEPASAAPAPAAIAPSAGEQQTATAVETVSLEQVTATTLALGKYGQRDVIKSLLAKYGVERASLIPEDKRAEYVAEARKHLPEAG